MCVVLFGVRRIALKRSKNAKKFIGKLLQSMFSLKDKILPAVIEAVVTTLMLCAIFLTPNGRALVKFLDQMADSLAGSKPFQGNKKYKNYNLK